MSEEIEQKARSQGWKPAEEWKGEPPRGGFVDAETFIERADEILPIVRAEREELKSEIAEMRKTLEQFNKHHVETLAKTEKRAFEQARQQLIAEQKKAIEEGDADKFAQVEDQKARLAEAERQSVQAVQQRQGSDDVSGIQAKWEKENPWFRDDFELYETAEKAATWLTKNKPGLKPEQFLAELKQTVARKHRDHPAFADMDEPESRSAQSFDSGDRQVVRGGRKAANSYENLPADAKADCDRYVRDKLLTKEQFLKDYYS